MPADSGPEDTPPTGQHESGPGCEAALIELISQHARAHGWAQPGMVLTDVLIVTSHRGFSNEGTKTGTAVICPTESSIATLLGLTQYASIHYGNLAARSMQGGGA